MYEQERTAAVGHAVACEEPHNRVHVGTECACWRAACRRQVPAEGHSGTVARRCGSKGESAFSSISTRVAGLKASVFLCSPPKLQNKNDPNLAIVPGDHPFLNAAALEAEGVTLLQRLITDLYTKQYVGSGNWAAALTNRMAHCLAFAETRTSYPPS